MAKVKRKPCETPDCPNLVTHGQCRDCDKRDYDAEIDRQVAEHEAERIRLGLPANWGCLDPHCEICS